MATLEMNGPYRLDNDTINRELRTTDAGNYALGATNDKKTFEVFYVGRSDNDLTGRLRQHVGSHREFKYSFALSIKAAFEKECHNYHDFGPPPDNKAHPARPEGEDWQCPACSQFDDMN
jgi:hypothetical protein